VIGRESNRDERGSPQTNKSASGFTPDKTKTKTKTKNKYFPHVCYHDEVCFCVLCFVLLLGGDKPKVFLLCYDTSDTLPLDREREREREKRTKQKRKKHTVRFFFPSCFSPTLTPPHPRKIMSVNQSKYTKHPKRWYEFHNSSSRGEKKQSCTARVTSRAVYENKLSPRLRENYPPFVMPKATQRSFLCVCVCVFVLRNNTHTNIQKTP